MGKYLLTLKCQTQEFSLTSPLEVKTPVESPLNFTPISAQKLLRTSDACALVRKVWERVESHFHTRDHHSIESSQNSWPKEVISQLETELAESIYGMKFADENFTVKHL